MRIEGSLWTALEKTEMERTKTLFPQPQRKENQSQVRKASTCMADRAACSDDDFYLVILKALCAFKEIDFNAIDFCFHFCHRRLSRLFPASVFVLRFYKRGR